VHNVGEKLIESEALW